MKMVRCPKFQGAVACRQASTQRACAAGATTDELALTVDAGLR
jgi:hypothetical protein